MFAEFKSVFVSEDILKENEQHANIVTAATMLNVFWLGAISLALTFFNIFKIGTATMCSIVIRSSILLAIPAVICYVNKGKGEWIKHLLFISFTIMLAMTDALLKYNVTLIIVLPIILSARYYNKTFKYYYDDKSEEELKEIELKLSIISYLQVLLLRSKYAELAYGMEKEEVDFCIKYLTEKAQQLDTLEY